MLVKAIAGAPLIASPGAGYCVFPSLLHYNLDPVTAEVILNALYVRSITTVTCTADLNRYASELLRKYAPAVDRRDAVWDAIRNPMYGFTVKMFDDRMYVTLDTDFVMDAGIDLAFGSVEMQLADYHGLVGDEPSMYFVSITSLSGAERQSIEY